MTLRLLPICTLLLLGAGAPSPEDMLRELDSDSYERRQAAQKALLDAGPEADPAIRSGCASSSQEVAERCRRLRSVRGVMTLKEALDPSFVELSKGRKVRVVGILRGVWDPDPRDVGRDPHDVSQSKFKASWLEDGRWIGLRLGGKNEDLEKPAYRAMACQRVEAIGTLQPPIAAGDPPILQLQDLKVLEPRADIPLLTPRLAQAEREKRWEDELRVVGRVRRGPDSLIPFLLDTPGDPRIWMPLQIEAPTEIDLNPWVGKDVILTGHLEESGIVSREGQIVFAALRVYRCEEAKDSDLKQAKDVPEGAKPEKGKAWVGDEKEGLPR